MPRKRSEESIEAEKLFHSGKTIKEIAQILNVPDGRVRQWKLSQKWGTNNKQRKPNVRKSKPNAVKPSVRKKGGQPGNKSAKGSGAPKGNKNAAKADDSFSRIYGSCFSEEEMALVKEMPDSEELILKDQIKVLVVREHRIIKRLNEYYKSQNEKTLDTESTQETVRVFEDGTPEENEMDRAEYRRQVLDEQAEGKRKPGHGRLLTRNLTNKDNYIARLEHELTTVQLAKERCIQDLMKYSLEKQKLDGNGESDATKAWLEALMETDGETDE